MAHHSWLVQMPLSFTYCRAPRVAAHNEMRKPRFCESAPWLQQHSSPRRIHSARGSGPHTVLGRSRLACNHKGHAAVQHAKCWHHGLCMDCFSHEDLCIRLGIQRCKFGRNDMRQDLGAHDVAVFCWEDTLGEFPPEAPSPKEIRVGPPG